MGVFLQVENLTKSFGADVLFHDISFGINEGDKVGLIAKNGTGKSTLLSVIAGVQSHDSGSVVFRSDLRVGYLPQIPTFDGSKTVIDVCLQGDDPTSAAIRNYEQALANGDTEHITQLVQTIDNLGAWNYEQRFKQILS